MKRDLPEHAFACPSCREMQARDAARARRRAGGGAMGKRGLVSPLAREWRIEIVVSGERFTRPPHPRPPPPPRSARRRRRASMPSARENRCPTSWTPTRATARSARAATGCASTASSRRRPTRRSRGTGTTTIDPAVGTTSNTPTRARTTGAPSAPLAASVRSRGRGAVGCAPAIGAAKRTRRSGACDGVVMEAPFKWARSCALAAYAPLRKAHGFAPS